MSLIYEGIVCSGAGKSSKWMWKYFPDLYPGTVNVKLERDKPTTINYKEIETEYGICGVARCRFNGMNAYIILPPRATLGNGYVEIGHQGSLRDRFNLFDGSKVEIQFYEE